MTAHPPPSAGDETTAAPRGAAVVAPGPDAASAPWPRVRVTDATEAAARDAAAIAAGVPSRALMQRAGAAAAAELARRFGDRLAGGVAVWAGPGNNGGDAWVVAGALLRLGIAVRVAPVGGDAPRTVDAAFERERVLAAHAVEPPRGDEALVVDGVLGTGAQGAPRGWAADAVRAMARRGSGGAAVVALDVPTGLDATTGETFGEATLRADVTLAFGTCKRGLLVARAHAGTIVVLDIGLGAQDGADDAPVLATSALVRRVAPPVAADAHKGTRGRLAIVGGAHGMAGAPTLAAEAALRSGAGLVRCLVAPGSVAAVQASVPAALAGAWPDDDAALDAAVGGWADAALLGPGLGGGSRALVERVLRSFRGPVVLDADALNAFAGELPALRAALGTRTALLTPHPLELARLVGLSLAEVLADRFAVGREVARATGATVLLKGVPTVVSAPDGRRLVAARGTPALATGGSGDVLGGIAVALLAGEQPAAAVDAADALVVGASAAWVHGRAAELATARRGGARGTTLADVLDGLSDAWPRAGRRDDDATTYPVLAELPAIVA